MKNILSSVLALLLVTFTGNLRAQVPVMSSLPSASAVIFLDFDGHTVDATSWNYAGPIYCGAAALNNTQITEIFNRVAEDYRPFNINITTDSTRYFAAPLNRRMRVILTVTSSWYGNAGGVAFVNSFTWGDDTPCFVFTALLNNNVKFIAEAASHEAGHTLGLYHQARYDANCVKLSDYHTGNGSGEIGWAPIMGVGYYQNFTLWNNGPNSYGCNNLQSDLDIITNANGFTYRTDDYNSALNNTATQASFVNNSFTISGVVERNTDQDNFRFTVPTTGRFTLNAIPYNVGTGNSGSNLDMQVTLYSSGGTALNVFNPGTLLSSVIDTTLNAGNYWLRVEGRGNVFAPNYASLGSYALQGNLMNGATLPLRRLELTGSILGDRHRLNWLIDADEQVVKQILEVSTDGRHFSPVTEPTPDVRQHLYKPLVNTDAQYRLNVTFDNGRQYYSNIIKLRALNHDARPVVISNMIQSGTIQVNSPGAFQYALYDYSGRQLAKGQLSKGLNTLPAGQLIAGLYLIRFSDGSAQQWTEKLVRP